MNTREPPRRTLSIAIGMAIVALLSACMSLERVDIPRSNPARLRERVHPGESVVVRLVSGEEKRFEVKAIEDDAIVGRRGQRVPYDDISTLDVSTRDVEGTLKSGLAVTALVAATLALLVIEAELEDDRTETYCDATGCDTR